MQLRYMVCKNALFGRTFEQMPKPDHTNALIIGNLRWWCYEPIQLTRGPLSEEPQKTVLSNEPQLSDLSLLYTALLVVIDGPKCQ